MSIASKQAELEEEFLIFDSWQDRLQLVIDTGEHMTAMEAAGMTEENRIHGCQNKVYLSSRFENGRMHYQGSSEAQIPRGLLAILLRVVDGEAPEAILKAEIDVFDRVGIRDALSMQRAVGLESMIKRVKLDAAYHIQS